MQAITAEGNWLGRMARGAVELLLPPVCAGCGGAIGRSDGLCAACWPKLRWIERPFCERLAIPFAYEIGAGALSAEAIADPPPFNRLRAACLYDELSGRLVQGFKYHDQTELAALLCGAMGRAAAELADDVDIVIPVPLHRWRLWRRRFNQSALLGAGLARHLGRPMATDILERIRATRRQVGLKAEARADNVRGAFRVAASAKPRIAGKRILLVDDVYTTGATVKAATRALLRGGAAAVEVAVFARVVAAMD